MWKAVYVGYDVAVLKNIRKDFSCCPVIHGFAVFPSHRKLFWSLIGFHVKKQEPEFQFYAVYLQDFIVKIIFF